MAMMGEPEPAALTGEDLTIAVKVRLVLRDHDWHAVPDIEDRVGGYSAGVVAGVLAQLVANGQVERDDTMDLSRCRLASRPR